MGKLIAIGAALLGLHGPAHHIGRLSMAVAKATIILDAQFDRPQSTQINWCVRENARTIYCAYTEHQPQVGGALINGQIVHFTVAHWDAEIHLTGTTKLTLSSEYLRRTYHYSVPQVERFMRSRAS